MVIKKAKTEAPVLAPSEKLLSSGSKIFAPFRTIGQVSNAVPHAIQFRGQNAMITTCIGNSFNIYDIETLNLLFVGPQFKSQIDSIVSIKNLAYVAVGNSVFETQRGKITFEFTLSDSDSIFHLLIYGDLLVGLSSENSIYVWTLKNRELYTKIDFNKEEFELTCAIHPSTYLDKILVASKQGSFRVINIKTRSQLFQSKNYGSPITTIEQSPALDIVAVGFLDGSIKLINIKADSEVLSFSQDGKVGSISFRTDLDNQAMMASSNLDGDIAIWNLEKRNLVCLLKRAHDGQIGKLSFLNNQPLLLTTGEDNKIIEWIFDNYNDGESSFPRILRHRSGHFANPIKIRFYGQDGKRILSAGRDHTLRLFSIIRDSQNVELSQRLGQNRNSRESRLPIISSFASEEIRQREWDNIITSHNAHSFASTWSMATKAIGKHEFIAKDKSIIKVAISPCGNFGYVGTLTGIVEMFNMQSGLSRRVFSGHSKSITGIQTDQNNRLVYTSSLDKKIIFFKHKDASIHNTIHLDCTPTGILLHRNSDLLAVICDDFKIRVFDAENGTMVRIFSGHRNRITDIAFSPDGRWLVSSSLDSTIRTWDLPSGNLVDIFRTTSVPISIAFSPSFDFLVSCHPDRLGLCLWTNKTMFEQVELQRITNTDSVFETLPTEIPSSELGTVNPDDSDTTQVAKETDVSDQTQTAKEASSDDDKLFMLPQQVLEQSLISTSSIHSSKWQTLLNLDNIKKRNKPVMPEKPLESAPFFLPTVLGLEPKFEKPKQSKKDGETKEENSIQKGTTSNDIISDSRVVFGISELETELSLLLKQGAETGNYSKFVEYIINQSASSIDFEIRSINSIRVVKQALSAILWQIQQKTNFDAIQAILGLILQIHSDLVISAVKESSEESLEMKKLLCDLSAECNNEWGKVDSLIRYNLCLIDLFCS
ncbi:hypothetical protein BB560_005016 [Smittium megazygosporum]|uniref:Uncharacterized protein n=1 Tax=Smittium megazygosporum TaxID=133381 RepID=A0A2T9Z7U1_9FUNG|nr:hypothetical protein BB560_005016 [Smittium megazygosporum]